MALSTIEAEYTIAAEVVKEALWFKGIVLDWVMDKSK